MANRLNDLNVYKKSIYLSKNAWKLYTSLPMDIQIVTGKQFIRAVDSIGANIAEGFGRYHYKDSLKFYYNARGSLWESKHWIYLLFKRGFVNKDTFDNFIADIDILGKQLNNFINRLKNAQ